MSNASLFLSLITQFFFMIHIFFISSSTYSSFRCYSMKMVCCIFATLLSSSYDTLFFNQSNNDCKAVRLTVKRTFLYLYFIQIFVTPIQTKQILPDVMMIIGKVQNCLHVKYAQCTHNILLLFSYKTKKRLGVFFLLFSSLHMSLLI